MAPAPARGAGAVVPRHDSASGELDDMVRTFGEERVVRDEQDGAPDGQVRERICDRRRIGDV